MVPLAGLEPAHSQGVTDFESVASTIPPQRHKIYTAINQLLPQAASDFKRNNSESATYIEI